MVLTIRWLSWAQFFRLQLLMLTHDDFMPHYTMRLDLEANFRIIANHALKVCTEMRLCEHHGFLAQQSWVLEQWPVESKVTLAMTIP